MNHFQLLPNYGTRIRAERELLGLTQSGLAAVTGVTSRTVAKYEQNETPFTIEWLARFAEAGADVDFVLYARRQRRRTEATEHERAFMRAFSWADEFCKDRKGKPAPPAVRLEYTMLAYRILVGTPGLDTQLSVKDLGDLLCEGSAK